jgi:hypothetical protein
MFGASHSLTAVSPWCIAAAGGSQSLSGGSAITAGRNGVLETAGKCVGFETS